MKEIAEEFMKRKFREFQRFKVNVISYKQDTEWKWDQEDTTLWHNIDLGMERPDHGVVFFPYLFPKSFEGHVNKDVMSLKMKDSSQTILHLFRVLKMVCDGHKLDSKYVGSSVSDAFKPVMEALALDNECAEHVVAGTVLDMLAECIVEGDAMVSLQEEPFESLGTDGRVVAELKDMSAQLKGMI
jgi:hypothetical protein